MNLTELHQLYQDLFALPRTCNPIKLAKRKLLRDEINRRIHEELDRRIASQRES